MQRFSTSVLLCFVVGITGCSEPHLSRGTAERALRGKVKTEITSDVLGRTDWWESQWGRGQNYEYMKAFANADMDYRNLLVAEGILKRPPDTRMDFGCTPKPECQQRDFSVYFQVIPSAVVKSGYPGGPYAYAILVLAKPSDPKVTGISEEGNDAIVEYEVGYTPTELYKRLSAKTQELMARCSLPSLSRNLPTFCTRWLSEAAIRDRKDHGQARFKKYDDGWRIVE
jgi:hypothetical protein